MSQSEDLKPEESLNSKGIPITYSNFLINNKDFVTKFGWLVVMAITAVAQFQFDAWVIGLVGSGLIQVALMVYMYFPRGVHHTEDTYLMAVSKRHPELGVRDGQVISPFCLNCGSEELETIEDAKNMYSYFAQHKHYLVCGNCSHVVYGWGELTAPEPNQEPPVVKED